MLGRTRVFGVATALVVAALSPAALSSGPAQASVRSQCHGQDRVLIKRVENVHRHFVATHVEGITLARGTAFKQTARLEHSRTLKATTNISEEVGGSANWGFASLSAKVSVSVASEGSRTSTRSVSRTFSIPRTRHDRRFVLFTGKYRVAGRWHYLSCSRAPRHGVEKYGPIRSFAGSDTGTVLCPRSRYKTSDYRYGVARQGGC